MEHAPGHDPAPQADGPDVDEPDVDEMAGDVLRDTAPRPVPGMAGRYRTVIPEAWRVMYAFGGTTMASALRAATVAVDRDDLALVSADATFCQAVPCGPVAMEVEQLRQGRSGAQALVRLWALDPQDPDPTGPAGNDLVVTVVFGRRDESPMAFRGAEPPLVKDPEECDARPLGDDSPFGSIPYHQQTEFRLAENMAVWNRPDVPPGEPRTASWFRFLRSPMRPDGTWEPGALAVPGDILGPAVHAGLGSRIGFFFVISLQISLHVVGDLRTEWVLQHTRAHQAGEGYASGTAELWDADRNLVAVATQLARLQPLDGAPGSR